MGHRRIRHSVVQATLPKASSSGALGWLFSCECLMAWRAWAMASSAVRLRRGRLGARGAGGWVSRSAGLLVSSSLARGGGFLASSSLSLLSGLFGSFGSYGLVAFGSNGPPLISGGMSDGSKNGRSRVAVARRFEPPPADAPSGVLSLDSEAPCSEAQVIRPGSGGDSFHWFPTVVWSACLAA